MVSQKRMGRRGACGAGSAARRGCRLPCAMGVCCLWLSCCGGRPSGVAARARGITSPAATAPATAPPCRALAGRRALLRPLRGGVGAGATPPPPEEQECATPLRETPPAPQRRVCFDEANLEANRRDVEVCQLRAPLARTHARARLPAPRGHAGTRMRVPSHVVCAVGGAASGRRVTLCAQTAPAARSPCLCARRVTAHSGRLMQRAAPRGGVAWVNQNAGKETGAPPTRLEQATWIERSRTCPTELRRLKSRALQRPQPAFTAGCGHSGAAVALFRADGPVSEGAHL